MHNLYKKGVWGYPLELAASLVLLAIILIFYSILFFGFDVAKSEAPVISSENYQDSLTLVNLLKTQVKIDNNLISVADAVDIFYTGNSDKSKLEQPITEILNKLPKPKNRNSHYMLKIINEDISLEFGESKLIESKFLEQKIYLPLSSKKNVLVKLYLSCSGCNKKEIEVIS